MDPRPTTEKKDLLVTSDSLGEEQLPAYHEELEFLPEWKRGVLGAGALLGLGGWVQLALLALEEWALVGWSARLVSYSFLAAIVFLAAARATALAWRGTVQVRRPSRFDRASTVAGLLVVALLAFRENLWIGGAAMLVCLWAAWQELDRLRASFDAGDPDPPGPPALPAGGSDSSPPRRTATEGLARLPGVEYPDGDP